MLRIGCTIEQSYSDFLKQIREGKGISKKQYQQLYEDLEITDTDDR